jgi:plastocyanin
MLLRLLVALVLVTAVGCGGAPKAEPCSDPVAAGTVRIVDFAFEPDCLSASSGSTIHLENAGDAPHSFTVQGTDVSVDLEAGASAVADLSGTEAGPYAVTCIYHPQMTATLTIA